METRAWHCCKCDAKMVQKKIPTTFLKMIGFENGHICPSCKAKFLTEDAVTVSIMGKELRGSAKMD